METPDDGFKTWLKRQAELYVKSYAEFLKVVSKRQEYLREALAHGMRREFLEAELKKDFSAALNCPNSWRLTPRTNGWRFGSMFGSISKLICRPGIDGWWYIDSHCEDDPCSNASPQRLAFLLFSSAIRFTIGA